MDSPLDLHSADGTRLAARSWQAGPPAPGVVILRGLRSREEDRADFAAMCRPAAVAALTLGLPGHGASGGELGPGTPDDAGIQAEIRDCLRIHLS